MFEIFFYSQNLIKTKRLGVSEGLNHLSLDVNEVKETLLNVLQNPSYTSNAKKWSARFQDQKEKPLDRAIWWIEWLLRNPNCDYLKSPILQLGVFAGNTYDVIAFIILIIIFSTIILLKPFCYLSRKCNGNRIVHHEKLKEN